MFLKFKINLREVGSLATENGLHVVVFYTDLVELKPLAKPFKPIRPIKFYTHLVELKHFYRKFLRIGKGLKSFLDFKT